MCRHTTYSNFTSQKEVLHNCDQGGRSSVDQKLVKKQFLYISTIWMLNRKSDNPLKAISPEVLKFRFLANSTTQESDDSHVDKVCISQFLKRFNLLHEYQKATTGTI